jgi:hypothetical protein
VVLVVLPVCKFALATFDEIYCSIIEPWYVISLSLKIISK